MPLGPAYKNKPAGATSAPLGTSGTELIFQAIAATLRAKVRPATILAWDDPNADASLPSGEGAPWIRLTPTPGPSAPYCRTPAGLVHRMPMNVAIETSVAGTDVAQSIRLWEVILSALFPLDPALGVLGVSRMNIVKPAWGPAVEASNRCEGSGELMLLIHYTTQG